jgi:hypothetical protein
VVDLSPALAATQAHDFKSLGKEPHLKANKLARRSKPEKNIWIICNEEMTPK